MKLRRFIINILDKKSDYCWAELVMWSLYRPFWTILNKDNFRQNCEKGNYYCGKCVGKHGY